MAIINSTSSAPSRRRFLTIAAAAAGTCLAGVRAEAASVMEPVRWRGTALGSLTEIRIHHSDTNRAKELITLALTEVRKLEGMFSLFNQASDLQTLNRVGVLEAPAPEFIELLTLARQYHRLSKGLFDPSVQPLWSLYKKHFTRPNASPQGPDSAALETARSLVGMDGVVFNRDRVVFEKRGMGMTLNGIAQGFITDKVVELLRRNGVEQTLVDLGEIRAVGTRLDGTPWRVAITDPADQTAEKTLVSMTDMSIATSGGYGFRFTDGNQFNHIFDPHNGTCANTRASASIILPTATAADALAKAACMMSEADISRLLTDAGGGEAWLIGHQGDIKIISG